MSASLEDLAERLEVVQGEVLALRLICQYLEPERLPKKRQAEIHAVIIATAIKAGITGNELAAVESVLAGTFGPLPRT